MNIKKFLIRASCIIAVVVISSILILFSLAMWWLFSSPYDDSKFNKDIWIQAGDNNETSCVRGAMVKDLGDNYIKLGVTTKTEVLSLLGDADDDHHSPRCAGYHIGMCKGIDYDSLFICFDHQSVVTNLFTQEHKVWNSSLTQQH